jgi:hypothetical protein
MGGAGMMISFLGLMVIGVSYVNLESQTNEDKLKFRGVGFMMLFGGFILAWSFPNGLTE